MTSSAKAEGRFGKVDFVYLAEENVYRCLAGEKLTYGFTNVENGQKLHRYFTNACRNCSLKSHCTTAPQRRITRDRCRHPAWPRSPRCAGQLKMARRHVQDAL
jgi:hypothetical protein